MSTEPVNEADPAEARESAQLISRRAAVAEARGLLREARFGVLSTLSRRHDGWPFGSLVPYALDRRGEPIILIAAIAEHTRNIRADDRVSLLVHSDPPPGDEDVQAHGRLTLMGRCLALPTEEREDAEARYLARVPDAVTYSETHQFGLHAIRVAHVRFIGGFGKIFWLDAAEIGDDPARDPLAEGAAGIVAHMNADHLDALQLMCRVFRSVEAEGVRMTGVDQWGFDVACQGPDRRLRFEFRKPQTMASIRSAVVEMVKEARQRSAQ